MPDSKKHPPVGIDLGTTFSAVAFLDSSGRPETIRSAEGDMTTPSAVFFDRKNTIVGIEAVEAGLLEPERLALYAKRDVGEDAYEKSIRGETFPPEVLQALVLQKLKSDAELKLGKITKAVITVPAFFNEPCRKATQDAGKLAGLEVLDIINEPTAAAITYGVQQGFLSEDGRSEQLERVLVYDLGGGTFDVTVMEIQDANYNTIATAGDVYLGGIDWDRRIVDFIAEAFLSEHGIDPREDPRGEQELVRKANQAKHALTQRESVSISFAFEGNRLRTELTQAAFAKMTEDLVERTLMTVQLVLDDAGFTWSDLTRLILVGGSTRMPMIRDELHQRSGIELDRSLSPDEAVSHGAALYAGMLLGHPDGEHAKVSVTNVNSHDLGILAVDPKTGNPRRQVMIARNSSLPAKKQMLFRTHSDNQVNVKIEVVEGGDDKGINATKIGKCVIDDLPNDLPKGTEVTVCFDYSQDGRLTVGASLPAVDREVQMTLNRAAGLSDSEIQSWRKRMDDGLVDPPKDSPIEQSPHSLPANDKPSKPAKKSPTSIVTENVKGPVAKSPATKRPAKAAQNGKQTIPAASNASNKVVAKPAVRPVVQKPKLQSPLAKSASKPKTKPPAKTPNVAATTTDSTPQGKTNTRDDNDPKENSAPRKPTAKPVAKKAAGASAGSGPKLDLGNIAVPDKVVAKPGEPDFSQLMSLGGQTKKPKSNAPIIITTDGPSQAKKKSEQTAKPKKPAPKE